MKALANLDSQSAVALESRTRLSFVHECFKKLDLGCIFVVRRGKYVGMVSRPRSQWSEPSFLTFVPFC